jgi:hypothetical protein
MSHTTWQGIEHVLLTLRPVLLVWLGARAHATGVLGNGKLSLARKRVVESPSPVDDPE